MFYIDVVYKTAHIEIIAHRSPSINLDIRTANLKPLVSKHNTDITQQILQSSIKCLEAI